MVEDCQSRARGRQSILRLPSKKIASPIKQTYNPKRRHSFMKKQIPKSALLIAICLQSASAIAATDTPETRRREAERYLQATPPMRQHPFIRKN
jgi:hypothetical protein